MTILQAGSVHDVNTFAQPAVVAPVTSDIALRDLASPLAIPPASVVKLALTLDA